MKKKCCSTCKYTGGSNTAGYCSLCSGYNGWEPKTDTEEEV